MERAKSYKNLVKEDWLLEDIQDFKMFEKRMVSVCMVDKRTHKNLSLDKKRSDKIAKEL